MRANCGIPPDQQPVTDRGFPMPLLIVFALGHLTISGSRTCVIGKISYSLYAGMARLSRISYITGLALRMSELCLRAHPSWQVLYWLRV